MESVLSNTYILATIFDQLTFQELLKVTKVSSRFCFAIKEYFNWKYKQVEAYKTRDHYIVSNKLKRENTATTTWQIRNRILLSHADFLEFLTLNSNSIEILYLYLNQEYEDGLKSTYYRDNEYFNNFRFGNLKKLNLDEFFLTEAELFAIIKNCPKLTQMSISGIWRMKGGGAICLNDIPITTLDKKTIIKCIGFAFLDLKDGHYSLKEDTYLRLEHIERSLFDSQVNMVKLVIERNSTDSKFIEETKQAKYCKVLTYGQIFDQEKFNTFCKLALKDFTNLQKLTVVSAPFIKVAKQFFVSLNTYCEHLEYLHLEYCVVKEFVPIKTLKEFILKKCRGFSGNDLKHIFAQQKQLKSFTSIFVTYQDQDQQIEISDQLSQLNLRYNYPDIGILSMNLKHITSLHWLSSDLTKQSWLNATNCPNLQTLEVKTSQLIFENARDFKFLKKLVLNVSEVFNSSDFFQVLAHPSVSYLALNDDPMKNFMNYKSYVEAQLPKLEKTYIKCLDVCFKWLCESHFFSFWSRVLASKLKIILRIRYNCLHDEVAEQYKHILSGFPSSSFNTNVCGYSFDLYDSQAAANIRLVSDDNLNNKSMQYVLLKSRNY